MNFLQKPRKSTCVCVNINKVIQVQRILLPRQQRQEKRYLAWIYDSTCGVLCDYFNLLNLSNVTELSKNGIGGNSLKFKKENEKFIVVFTVVLSR